MKFESKYGIGEICGYGENRERDDRMIPDVLVEIVAVVFEEGNSPQYQIEFVDTRSAIHRLMVREQALNGDPRYDQEAGCYPTEPES